MVHNGQIGMNDEESMKPDLQRTAEGFLFSFSVSAAARWKKALSASGMAGAVIIGTTYYSLGGPLFYSSLMAFFLTGSFLSHYGADKKKLLTVEYEKGSERDILQVFANGFGGALFLILHRHFGDDPLMLSAFLGSMAAVTADTWATEIGATDKNAPRHILTGKPVPAGTSGAVSLKGIVASALGALLPGMCVLMTRALGGKVRCDFSIPGMIVSSWAGGIAGAFADSLLGALLQAQYYCEHCRVFTEKKVHWCGGEAARVSGLYWFGNDAVNFASSLAGAATSALIYYSVTGVMPENERKIAQISRPVRRGVSKSS